MCACKESGLFSRSLLVRLAAWTIVLAAMCQTLCAATAADNANSDRDLLRYDPIRDELVVVPEAEAKAGCIYSHFSHA